MLFIDFINKLCYYTYILFKDVLILKRIFCVLLCFVFIFGLTGCNDVMGEGSSEFRILELTENKIPNDRDFAIVDKNDTPILTNNDVQKVLVVFEKTKDRYLELRLTKEGAKKFKKALRKKDAELSIVLDGEKLASPVIADDVEDTSAIVLGEYEDVMHWFNQLT